MNQTHAQPTRDRVDGVRSAIHFVIDGHRFDLGKLAATAFLGGLVEALFLVTVTRSAFAITNGADEVGVIAGRYFSIELTLVIAVGLVVLRIALATLASWQAARLTPTVVAGLRRRLASAFFQASWTTQQRHRAGSLQELMSTYCGQASALMTAVSVGVVASANLLALLGLAVAVDPLGALVLVISISVLGSLLRPLRTVIRRRSRSAAQAGMELATSVSEASQLGLEYDVFDVHEEALSRMNELIERTRERGQKLQFATGLATPMYVGLAYMALIGALGFVAASDATSLTSLGAAMLVMLRSLSYGQALQGATVSVSAATPVIEEFDRQLDQFDLGRRRSGGEPLEAIGEIGADELSFSYGDDREVLTDISFTISPREVVGIVGPSGSGKSTLVQLLLGLQEPSSGRVLANGRDIRTLDRRQWARKITFVPQEAHLITGTIAENIEFLRDGVSRVDIEEASRLANLHDDIMELPDGYERVLGSDGARLSGGQQQRLCIARALVERPDVLILDEPTSALDPRSEHLLRGVLSRLAEQMTVIVIAHRLSTLEICDRIMVVQHGRMVGFDAPDRLRESSTFFRDALAVSDLR